MFSFNWLKGQIAMRNRMSELERQINNLERRDRWTALRLEKLEKRMNDQQAQIDNLTQRVSAQNQVIVAQGEVIATQGETMAAQGDTIAKINAEVEALKNEHPDIDLSALDNALKQGQEASDANTAKLQENTAKLVANNEALKKLDDVNPDAEA